MPRGEGGDPTPPRVFLLRVVLRRWRPDLRGPRLSRRAEPEADPRRGDATRGRHRLLPWGASQRSRPPGLRSRPAPWSDPPASYIAQRASFPDSAGPDSGLSRGRERVARASPRAGDLRARIGWWCGPAAAVVRPR